MKNTYIIIIVVILLGVGSFFVVKNNKSEAPIVEDNTIGNVQNNMSIIDNEGGIAVDTEVFNDTSIETNINNKGEIKEFIVTGKNFSFVPSTIAVNKGDRVKITFVNSEGFHALKIDEYGVSTKQANAPNTEVLEFIANKTGSFEYYCSVGSHKALGMKGNLIVQ